MGNADRARTSDSRVPTASASKATIDVTPAAIPPKSPLGRRRRAFYAAGESRSNEIAPAVSDAACMLWSGGNRAVLPIEGDPAPPVAAAVFGDVVPAGNPKARTAG